MAEVTSLPVVFKDTGSNGHRRSSRCHFRNGVCVAALRALTAARVYLAGDIDLEQAAISHGSNVHYVRAGIILVRANDLRLIDAVLRGEILITTAAESVEPLLMLLEGYEKASAKVKDDFFVATGCNNDLGKLLITSPATERTRAAERLDAETVWNQMVLPLVRAAE
jgi:hypothetical protein